MCLILTPIVYLWVQEIHLLLLVFAVYGFFIQGVFSWTPIWLPELFPTRMRATAAGFIFNAPRLISAIAPLIAGTLIVGLGGYGKAATIIGLFYILGLIAVPFLPETKGKPLPEADCIVAATGRGTSTSYGLTGATLNRVSSGRTVSGRNQRYSVRLRQVCFTSVIRRLRCV